MSSRVGKCRVERRNSDNLELRKLGQSKVEGSRVE